MSHFPGFKHIHSEHGIDAYELVSNGLQVLLAPSGNAPVSTFMITYRVGSRNEAIGETGATHFLEHMMFKGTEKFSKASGKTIFNVLQARGARVNATTWNDRTNYYEMLPSEHLGLAVEIEADRMRGLLLDPEEVASEKTVILNEFDRGENEPLRKLIHSVWSSAFVAHPYHHPTIGWRKDIEQVTSDGLRSFYDRFYWPNNATVSVIGGFEAESVLETIRSSFGPLPSGRSAEVDYADMEPKQIGERRVTIRMSGGMPAIIMAFKSPGIAHDDWPALYVAGMVLSQGKSSRLAKALVDTGMATWQTASPSAFQDPGLFSVMCSLTAGTDVADVETTLVESINELASNIQEDEIQRAFKKMEAQILYARDGSFSLASQLNEAIASGDWTLYTRFLERAKKVTAAGIKDVVQRYMVKDQMTIGEYQPKQAD
ncbi:MAG: insulinase family protein [Bacteroidetes Order II. Incertae sedis bacterium]|nr:insulinase family protein [Bacteroidetes Order II. bacterium]MBT4603901.1 insulinase family protein [Bacteroidetes Order II. bacterium]MBT6201037.1 insulinase family protein [Bacteroidetes Order II. bacterium]MBT6425388.1 insulinase family protein [Bacteroidetes Order II. bacterium]MBT6580944.1 insulinase family protein [Bacteroidetes Order II. bacterium]